MSRVGMMRWVWLLAVVMVAGCAPAARFSFDVTADSRGFTPPTHPGPSYFAGAVMAIRDLGPGVFMISPGDVDPPDRTRACLDDVLGIDYVWYPVVGNHETEKPEYMEFLRAYNEDGKALPNIIRQGPPGAVETCYAFDYGNAHFAVVNEYYDGESDMVGPGRISEPLFEWLEADLNANDKPLVFVVGHEPVVAAPDINNGRVRHRGDSLDQFPEETHRFWSLLREHNVLAYICGHTHNASVLKINGIWQLDAGHSRGKGDPGAPSSFMRIHIDGEHVICETYSDDMNGGPYRMVFREQLQ